MDSLSITQRRTDDVVILDLAGKLTIGGTNSQLKETLRQLTTEGERSIVLNMSGLTFVDSSGLGELVSGYSTLKRENGRLALVGLSGTVLNLMTITKLYTVFDTYDSEAEAVKSFGTSAGDPPTLAASKLS
jgi:anti-sigma B factor antagonist